MRLSWLKWGAQQILWRYVISLTVYTIYVQGVYCSLQEHSGSQTAGADKQSYEVCEAYLGRSVDGPQHPMCYLPFCVVAPWPHQTHHLREQML